MSLPPPIPDVFSSASFVREANSRLGEAVRHPPPLRLPGVGLACHHIHIAPGQIPAGTISGEHQHLEIQFEFVLHGSMSFTTTGGSVACRLGEGVCIAPLLNHSWEALSPLLVLGVLIRADGDQAQAFLHDLRQHQGNSLQLVSPPAGPDVARQIVDLLVQPQTIWGAERLSTWFQLWLTESLAQTIPPAWRETVPALKASQPYQATLSQRSVEFIQANLSHPLRVEDVARQFGISVRHLSRVLRTHEGLTFQQLLRRFRLQHAHRLLRSGDMRSVKEAALSSGFTSPAYFTHCFQREFQTLPGLVLAPPRQHG
jgi:AraC-like DNA-binding protein